MRCGTARCGSCWTWPGRRGGGRGRGGAAAGSWGATPAPCWGGGSGAQMSTGERSGARKVWWQLHREHVAAGRCTVERLMRRLGLRGVRRGGYKVVAPVPDAPQDRPGDLLDRDFRAPAPNRLWVVVFTYGGTWAGTVYTALVIDAFSRMIVGWRTAGHHRMTLVLDALVMAVAARRREGVSVAGAIHHSDAGSEYLAIRYGRELTAAGMTPSVGSVGDSYDNALAESVIGLYKTEVIAHQGPWRDLAQVETATAARGGWVNQPRLFWPHGRPPPPHDPPPPPPPPPY